MQNCNDLISGNSCCTSSGNYEGLHSALGTPAVSCLAISIAKAGNSSGPTTRNAYGDSWSRIWECQWPHFEGMRWPHLRFASNDPTTEISQGSPPLRISAVPLQAFQRLCVQQFECPHIRNVSNPAHASNNNVQELEEKLALFEKLRTVDVRAFRFGFTSKFPSGCSGDGPGPRKHNFPLNYHSATLRRTWDFDFRVRKGLHPSSFSSAISPQQL